jgi:tRNA1(Val) A37 N6-methylase TrmN6
MWPVEEQEAFATIAAAAGLHLQNMLQVRDRAGSRITRIIGIYGRQKCGQVIVAELIIKSPDGSYTASFIDLLSAFYLHF